MSTAPKAPAVKPMTRTEMIAEIATQHGMTKTNAASVVDAVFGIIHREVRDRGVALLPGLGKLVIDQKPAREVVDLKTQERRIAAAKTSLKYKAASAFKADVVQHHRPKDA